MAITLSDGEKLVFAAVYAQELYRAQAAAASWFEATKIPSGDQISARSIPVYNYPQPPWSATVGPLVNSSQVETWCIQYALSVASQSVVNARVYTQAIADAESPATEAYDQYSQIFTMTAP